MLGGIPGVCSSGRTTSCPLYENLYTGSSGGVEFVKSPLDMMKIWCKCLNLTENAEAVSESHDKNVYWYFITMVMSSGI